MGTTKKYWKGVDELKETPSFLQNRDQEFPEKVTVDEFLGDESLQESSTARRDFLKFLGFSVAAATVAACETPVTKAIPYVVKPENVTPGMPTWYASTYYDGNSYGSILVKTREGRPIYIKGNKDFGFTQGVVNPQIVASVLGLYEGARLKNPTIEGKEVSDWSKVDNALKAKLADAKAKGEKVVLVSNTIISPSTNAIISKLGEACGSFEHIQYDAISYSGIRNANLASFGLNVIPDYDFAAAKTIVSLGADFLGSWLSSTEYSAQYATRRNPDGEWMSRHFQFESMMSIAGSNADYRSIIKPSQQANVLAYILKAFGVSTGVQMDLEKDVKHIADEAIKSLKHSKGESIVVCGSNNKAVQILTNKLNEVLGNYNSTINLNNPLKMFMSEDDKMNKLVTEVIAGKGPAVVMFYGTNPVYTLPNGRAFGAALSKVSTTVSLSGIADETAALCKYVAPNHHALEAWNDYNAKGNAYALAQPSIRPLFNTRAAQETLLVLAGEAKHGGKDSKIYYDFIVNCWETEMFTKQTAYADFGTFWNMTIHNSVCEMDAVAASTVLFQDNALVGLSSKLPKGGDLEVVMYQKAGIGNGEHTSNPWLQEMPDPITKVTWDNYITMNPVSMKGDYAITFDQESGLNMATVTVNGSTVTLPVYPAPGQAPNTVGIALGYGRGANGENIGKAAFQTKEYGGHVEDEKGNPVPVGANVYPFVSYTNGSYSLDAVGTMKKVDGIYPIAATQIHHTVMGRHSIVRETTLNTYKKDNKEAYNPAHQLMVLDDEGHHTKIDVKDADLWDAHPVENIGHRWGMAIDLSSCIGCGSCMIACQSENNVPVVGKDEVRRGREMHWIRIDRYFSSDEEAAVGTRKGDIDYHAAEHASLNPKVVHMPMMCHHCNHAPCETVCPVAATTHSNEGLNQMVYNRCIGTRYCANNCPYKVRRFNWFNYPSYKKFTEVNPAQDDLGRMVLNPDVTVRTRGVMEKCSFCVQRIQAGKLDAKTEGRAVKDGDVVTACADVCPTNAIQVGDWNDLQSMVRKSTSDDRAYQALEEVGVKPNVWYKVKVRNEENALLDKLQSVEEVHHEEGGHEESKDNKSHH